MIELLICCFCFGFSDFALFLVAFFACVFLDVIGVWFVVFGGFG